MPFEKVPTVLVIMSDAVQRDLILLALRRLNLDPLYTPEGADALPLFQSIQPRLVILDIYLPNQNGLDLLRQFQANGWLAATEVMVVSTFAFPEVVQQAVEAGARDFLVKPVDTDLLVERVREILRL